MQSERVLTKSYLNSQNQEVGKFTVQCVDTTVYTSTASGGPTGFRQPTAANDGPIAGVATDSILPFGFFDYQGGTYLAGGSTPPTSVAWPSGATPSNSVGQPLALAVSGIYRCLAAGAITEGQSVCIADQYGRVATVNNSSVSGLVAGAAVNEVGVAVTSAVNANDVLRVRLTLQYRAATTASATQM